MKSDQPSLDLVILALLLSVDILGALMIFFKPAYEAGAYAVVGALITALTGACGAKWGLSQSAKPPSVEHPTAALETPDKH